MEGVGNLIRRIQSSSEVLMVLATSIFVPMVVESSNQKQVHQPTVIFAVTTFILALALFFLVFSIPHGHDPGPRRYVAVKILLHLCTIALVALSFSLSLMMRMNLVASYFILAAAGLYVVHRLWQCAGTALGTDLDAYTGSEEEIHQLLETSTAITSILFGGWFGTAFFYFQNFPEDARDARVVPSEYLIFFSSAAASLMIVKAVPRRLPPIPQSVRELRVLVCALVAAAVATALVIAASKVGWHAAALALVPVAVALAVGCAQWAKDRWGLPIPLPACLQLQGDPEPLWRNFLLVTMTLLVAVLSYHVKDHRALSTLYAKMFVVVAAAAAVAALFWMLLTLPPVRTWAPGVQAAAAKVLAYSTICLLLMSVLGLAGVLCGW